MRLYERVAGPEAVTDFVRSWVWPNMVKWKRRKVGKTARPIDELRPRDFAIGRAKARILMAAEKSARPHIARLATEIRTTGLATLFAACVKKLGKTEKVQLAAIDELRLLADICAVGGDQSQLAAYLPALLRCLDDKSEQVRRSAIELLGHFKSERTNLEIVRAVVAKALAPQAATNVIEAAIQLLFNVGQDAAALAVPSLVGLLEHGDATVPKQVCETLGWLRRDATKATAALLQVATQNEDPATQLAAIEALKRISPKNKWLPMIINDARATERLIEHLRRIGERGRRLRQLLGSASAGKPKVAKGRSSHWGDLQRLHDEMRGADSDVTDVQIIKEYRKQFKRGGTWKEPTVRTLRNYRARLRRKQKSAATDGAE